MKNKGFTLVELIATLIVLSLVALIVVPNINENINEAKKGIKITQLESIVDCAKEWAADHITELSFEEDTYVFLKDLQSGGYIDYNLYKNTDGEQYNDNLFVLIKGEIIESDEWNNENYKYTYTIYDTNEKYLSYLASLYVQNNNITSNKTLTISDLLPYANSNLIVSSQLKNIEDGTLINNVSVTIRYFNGNYTYNVSLGQE